MKGCKISFEERYGFKTIGNEFLKISLFLNSSIFRHKNFLAFPDFSLLFRGFCKIGGFLKVKPTKFPQTQL